MHPDVEKEVFSQEAIAKRIQELGERITKDYAGREIVIVGVLKGAWIFLADLIRHIDVPCSVDFLRLSSYHGTESRGVVRMLLDLGAPIEGKDVLFVEDIVDTGLTLDYLERNMKTRKPRSIEVVCLLDKKECRKVPIDVKYVGFEIPNEFVIGYGLDYNERYRNLPYIGTLKKALQPG